VLGILNVPLTSPTPFAISGLPSTGLVVFEKVSSSDCAVAVTRLPFGPTDLKEKSPGVQNDDTSTPAKKAYTLVFGKNPLPSKEIVLGLTNGTNALDTTLFPCDSNSIFSTTVVLKPVLD
jgi:hypothetical protein